MSFVFGRGFDSHRLHEITRIPGDFLFPLIKRILFAIGIDFFKVLHLAEIEIA